MKTLIHILTANRWGGIERYALDICRHYSNLGWDVAALTRDAKAVDDMFVSSGIPILHAPLNGMWDFRSIRLLSKKIKETEWPVIIHAHGFRNVFTALAARRFSGKKDTKVIVTRHKVRRGVDSWILRKIYQNVDEIVFVSRAARDRFLSTWHNKILPFPTSRIHVIHNSLNFLTSPYQKPQHQHPVTAMFHGPLKSGKGLEYLIDAMSLLKGKRIRLKIVGSGTSDYVDKLRRRAISRGVMESIDWVKHTDNPIPLIMECDFGVLPSVDREAFGLSNVEYMAAGRPQICSSNGAQPEYITDGREGFLIPPGNAAFLAETMEKLAGNPELRENMGRLALQTFNERLSWANFISKFSIIYY
ncbi:MAG: glycosyltransferase family 4 protein [Muribaculaceae bacterium]|nr:glycosyltransferase family 4 protein [Muribaculaceae bacterium]